MFTPFARYDEFTAAALNSRLDQLAARYEANKNPFETIVQGTLAATASIISLPVVGAEWNLLRLRTSLPFTLAGSETPVLLANASRARSYKYAVIGVEAAGTSTYASSFPADYGTRFLTSGGGYPLVTDLWIVPVAAGFGGFLLLGSWTGRDNTGSGIAAQRVGCSYRAAPITSLDLSFQDSTGVTGAGSLFSIGGMYQLEGMPA